MRPRENRVPVPSNPVRDDMRLPRSCLLLLALLGPLGAMSNAEARAGIGQEDPWAAGHIQELPQDVQRLISPQLQACGSARAQHSFARYLAQADSKPEFVALHFEMFGCRDRAKVCTSSGCLHQVYSTSRTGYRLVYTGYVRELELKRVDDVAAIEISCAPEVQNCRRTLWWNGRGFLDARPSLSSRADP